MGQTYPQPLPPDHYVPEHVFFPTYYRGASGEEGIGSTANSTVPDGVEHWVTQAGKVAFFGQTPSEDVGRPAGWIAPNEGYHAKPASPAGDPVVTSILPTTAPSAQLPLTVTITGTGFTEWSTVHTGGSDVADVSGRYVSPTTMQVAIYAAEAGTVSVAVKDHGVMSNDDVLFTVT